MYIGAYVKQELTDEVDIELFRYPEEFNDYLNNNIPDIACFTVFTWNLNLAHEYAKRIKDARPETVTVFGGVNFPSKKEERKKFLQKYYAIDFFIDGEGEAAFVEFYKTLKGYNLDGDAFKNDRKQTPSIVYVVDDELINPNCIPRLSDLDVIPSPYANGFSDKFFDSSLSPIIQRTRGCPYSCTFCHEGDTRFNKIAKFSLKRIEWELNYIAERAKVPELFFIDLNFGMFKEDVIIAQYVAEIRERKSWPYYLIADTAKNNKDRIIQISNILQGALLPGASVQSTDPGVLGEIKRKNLPLEQMVQIAKTRETDGASSRSEIILCLPGDTKAAHIKSVKDVMTSGISLLKTHQFMLLEGTEAASEESRQNYAMQTRFRVQPRCFGRYSFRGEEFHIAEIEEICVENATMTYGEYLECRDLTLTVEIFNNDGLFYDLIKFLEFNEINQTEFIFEIHKKILEGGTTTYSYYQQYREEESANLWKNKKDLEDHLNLPGIINEYIDGKHGNNELYKYRALSVFENIDELHDLAYEVSAKLLDEKGKLCKEAVHYLTELKQLSMYRKKQFLDIEHSIKTVFHYDFVKLMQNNFMIHPFSVKLPRGVKIEVEHTRLQKKIIQELVDQYGTTLVGLARILGRSKSADLHRSVRVHSQIVNHQIH